MNYAAYEIPVVETATTDVPYDLQLSGNLLYAATWSGGLGIFDASSPGTFVEVGSVNTPGVAIGIALDGCYAYIADVSSLQIADVSDPTAPSLLGSAPMTYAQSVGVYDDYAYVASYVSPGEVHIVDVSDPAAPVLQSVWIPGTGGGARKVLIDGSRGYVTFDAELYIVDLTNPTNPAVLGTVALPGPGFDLFLEGEFLFVAADGWFAIVDVTDPSTPLEVGALSLPAGARWVSVWGDMAILSGSSARALVVDVSDRAAPEYLGWVDVGGAGRDVVTRSGEAIVGIHTGHEGRGRLAAFPLDSLSWPSFPGAIETGRVREAELAGEELYLVSGPGFEIWDVEDPLASSLIGAYAGYPFADIYYYSVGVGEETAVLAGNVNVYGGVAFVLDFVDVSDPMSPQTARILGLGSVGAYDVETLGECAYAVRNGVITRYDISSGMPVFLGDIAGVGAVTRLDTANGLIYASGGGLEVFDPQLGATIGYVSLGGTRGIAVQGDLAYVAAEYILYAVDVSDPAAPAVAGMIDLGAQGCRFMSGLEVQGDFVYVPCGYEVHVIDVSDPSEPERVTAFRLSNPDGVELIVDGGEVLYVVGNGSRPPVFVAAPQCPTTASSFAPVSPSFLIHVAPNPFRQELAVRFHLERATTVQLGVYDVRGRLVQRLVDGSLSPGPHTVTWEGRGSGRALPGGVYFVRLAAGAESGVCKVVLLR